MDKKIIIGLTGLIGSGKGTITSYLEQKYNAHSFRFSTAIRDVLTRLALPLIRENIQKMSTVLRQNFGEDVLALAMNKSVNDDSHELIVIDGIRRMADIELLVTQPNFHLISILADAKNRYSRIAKRNENTDDLNKTYEQFLEDDKRESEIEIPKVMSAAKWKINNNGNIEDLHIEIDNLIIKLIN